MRNNFCILIFCAGIFCFNSCKKNGKSSPIVPLDQLSLTSIQLNGNTWGGDIVFGVNQQPVITLRFSDRVNQSTVSPSLSLTNAGITVPLSISYQNSDSVVIARPSSSLQSLTKYSFSISGTLKSAKGGTFISSVNNTLTTAFDTSKKFPTISDSELLDKVQQQTFKYFWDFGHPTSGLARERNSSGDIVTSGGSGFGIMAIPAAISRSFITRAEGLLRMQKIVGFLKNNAVKVKGAFPHWLNGSTGAIVPFSANDNGADLVETSYLMAGLLTARQYFDGNDAAETTLRKDINDLWNAVEWDWFRNSGQDVLYWHYSTDKEWAMNFQIKGWNECLITYIMAASSTTHKIPKSVYTNGWAGSSTFSNGSSYYGYKLPLGPAYGGPLFFSHYSFLGVNPNGLSDTYANYTTQTINHSLINYEYCKANPRSWYGYSDSCWGLTASDIPNGYTANSPTNDMGVITPTAAISSLPYTPAESMKALKFFYYVLGDKLWKDYGFVDAFSLKDIWFADSFLAIDQGPIIVMIENYRTQLIWNLFTSCPEIKNGMRTLGFTAPYL